MRLTEMEHKHALAPHITGEHLLSVVQVEEVLLANEKADAARIWMGEALVLEAKEPFFGARRLKTAADRKT